MFSELFRTAFITSCIFVFVFVNPLNAQEHPSLILTKEGVEKIRENMVKNNQEINWVPDAIKNGRFGKWLE